MEPLSETLLGYFCTSRRKGGRCPGQDCCLFVARPEIYPSGKCRVSVFVISMAVQAPRRCNLARSGLPRLGGTWADCGQHRKNMVQCARRPTLLRNCYEGRCWGNLKHLRSLSSKAGATIKPVGEPSSSISSPAPWRAPGG